MSVFNPVARIVSQRRAMTGLGAGAGPAAGGSPTVAAEPLLEPFNRRVHLVVSIVDRADEVALAIQRIAALGWSVRPVESADHVSVEPGRTALLVEARLRGARSGAEQGAVREIDLIAEQSKIEMWAREAAVKDRKGETRTTYHVRRTLARRRGVERWVFGFLAILGLLDIGRSLSLPGGPDPAAAAAELSRRPLAGQVFDPGRHELRVAMAPRPFSSSGGGQQWWRRLGTVVGALAVSALVFGCGVAVEALPGPWKALPVITGLLIAVPIGTWITGNFPQALAVRAFVGVSCVAIVAYMGGLEAENVGRGVAQACRAMGVVLLLGLAGTGCWLAVRFSWFSRNASWVVPGLLTLLPLTLPWLGGLLNAVYLSDGFGIPVSSIDIPYYWTFAVALEPAGIAGLFVMFFIGMVGWVRHFHQSSASRGAMAVAVPVLCVVYVLTAVLVGMQGAAKAAGRGADDVSAGRTPDRYFGLQGQLMCLIPLDDKVPVFNGPLPTGHPVLTFGGSGDQLWAWDPLRPKGRDGSQQAVGFAAADVALVQPRAGSCRAAKV